MLMENSVMPEQELDKLAMYPASEASKSCSWKLLGRETEDGVDRES